MPDAPNYVILERKTVLEWGLIQRLGVFAMEKLETGNGMTVQMSLVHFDLGKSVLAVAPS